MSVIQFGDAGDNVWRLNTLLALIDQAPGDREVDRFRFTEPTAEAVRRFQESVGLEPTGVVDERTARRLEEAVATTDQRAVLGRVTEATGRPASDVVVTAVDRNLAEDTLLGRSRLRGADGTFAIRYELGRLGQRDKTAADLVVSVLAADETMVQSPVVPDAQPVEWVDLVVPSPAAVSDFDDTRARLTRRLPGLSPASLESERDLAYAATVSGLDQDRVRRVATSERLANRLGVEPAAVYAWDHGGLVTGDGDLADLPLASLRAALESAIESGIAPARLAESVDTTVAALAQVRAARLLDPKDAERGTLARLLPGLTGDRALDDQQAQTLALALVGADPDADLPQVATAAGLTERQVEGLRGAAALAIVTRDAADLHLTASQHVDRITAEADLDPLLALATLSTEEWYNVVRAARPRLGGRATVIARELHQRVAALLPTETLLGPAAREPGAPTWQARLGDLAPVRERNDGRLDLRTDFDDLDTTALTDALRQAARAAYADLQRTAATYPGLQLDQLWAKTDDPATAATELTRRVALVATAVKANPGLDLLTLDYLPDSPDEQAIRLDGMSETDRAMVVDVVKAHQRTYRVSPDPLVARQLIDQGFGSARSITRLPYAEFCVASGLAEPVAQQAYLNAAEASVDAHLQLFALLDYARPLGHHKGVTGTISAPPDVGGYLRKLAGFDQMFGILTSCRCEHCKSVLSPAAYFVDLMRFVDANLTRQVFTEAKANHRLRLRRRRPDLWQIPLTCANTETLIPTLDLVNEILEDYLVKDITPAPVGRAAIRAAAYARLAGARDSFDQPFVLPLRRIEAYLRHFARTRADVATALGSDDQTFARAWLGLSLGEAKLISTAGDTALLARLYGAPVLAALNPPKPVDLQLLVRATGVGRDDLVEMLRTATFVRGTATVAVAGAKSSPGSLADDLEVVSGLSEAVLDRLHRFVRLRRRLRWSIADLDLVLTALRPAGTTTPVLGATQLTAVTRLAELGHRFRVPIDVLCSLFGPIPTAAPPGSRSLLDRQFNLDPFTTADGAWPNGQPFTHPALGGGTSTPNNRALQRLLAGLGVDDQGLVDLISGLQLGAAFGLDAACLALLHRHARLAELLGLSIPGLFQLLRSGGIGGTAPRVANLDDLRAAIRFADAWRTSGFTLDELGFVTGGPVLSAAELPDVDAVTAAVAAAVRDDRAFEFADTVFTQLPDVTEAQSRALVAANRAAFTPAPGSQNLQLKPDVDPRSATLAVPAGVPTTAAAVRGLLDAFHPREILPSRFAALLGVPEVTVRGGSTLLGDALATHRTDLVTELRGSAATPRLRALVAAVSPLTVLFRNPAWEAAGFTLVAANPAAFALTLPLDSNPPSPAAAFAVAAYARRCAPADPAFAPSAAPPDPAAVRQVVQAGFGDDTVLARALRVPPAQLTAVKAQVTLDASRPFVTLDRLAAVLALAGYFGVSGETLRLIVPTTTDSAAELAALSQAAEGLYALIRTKYPDEATFLARIEPHEDEIRGLRRDGLVDYALRSLPDPFTEPSDLYAHFLIDTQVEGCARTSRIVAASASLQLYIHRVLMNLEQDDLPADSTHIHVRPDQVPGSWEWMRNYRVWEANRKVFLFPENYLEPPLRDDKTPLFADLEAELLAAEISEQSATNAYASYLAGFREVSRLQIAGSYAERRPGATTDVLHLFGATASDPPVFYYRAITDLHTSATNPAAGRRVRYSPWLPLKLQIPAPRVSPVPFRGTLYLFWASVSTQEKTAVTGGTSSPAGFRHKISVKYAARSLDGTWSAPQTIRNPRYDQATFAFDSATARLVGFPWDRVYPGELARTDGSGSDLFIAGTGSGGDAFDPYTNAVVGQAFDPKSTQGLLSTETLSGLWRSTFGLHQASGSVLGFGQKMAGVAAYHQGSELLQATAATSSLELVKFRRVPVADLVNGATTDCVVDLGGDLYLLHEVVPGTQRWLHRLGTTAAEPIAVRLHRFGLGPTLSLDFQETLVETAPPIESRHPSVLDKTFDPLLSYRRRDGTVLSRPIDFTGPYGTYFREIFFQIPFLIADHLNGAQRFSAAQRWYHTVFDPTSSDADADRVWRYREFRGRTPETVRKMLTDPAALAAYRDDPFNPHAIARLRLGAYQKAVVMKYVDNLLDWGDALFTEFTLESVNEATMLYVLAADILGPRPPDLGPCGDGDGPVSYADIERRQVPDSEFLVELEHLPAWTGKAPMSKREWLGTLGNLQARVQAMSVADAAATSAAAPGADAVMSAAWPGTVASGAVWRTVGGTELRAQDGDNALGASPASDGVELGPRAPAISTSGMPLNPKDPSTGGGGLPGPGGLIPYDYTLAAKFTRTSGKELLLEGKLAANLGGFGILQLGTLVTETTPVFCLPRNAELLAYWGRVEKRLFQIRNCMDITGARRALSLFAPEIDPRLLVRARAAGLSLDDVLGTTAGNVPPYRFGYLIDKARQFAASVQAFGSALRPTLEAKDAEQLNQLRTVHEQNTLKLRNRALRAELDAASDSVLALRAQRRAVEYRRSHFSDLSDKGLTDWERVQQVSRHLAASLKGAESIVHLQAAITYLIPQLGSPFAMKYGGQELGHSGVEFAQWTSAMASILDAVANSAGLEATFQRRDEDWRHQARLAEEELAGLDRQIDAAVLRTEIAQNALDVHDKSVEQTEEIFAFYREKFTGHGLYTLLATRLHRLHRQAFNAALAVAKMAEQAYRFERRDDSATVLGDSYWDAAQAGLLAGDRLLLDLEELERRYLETNHRRLEITQHFSLRQFDPAALLALQAQGECEFAVPEVFFDLSYPGHYRRLLKAVRLTLPCIVGPQTSVGAMLRLLDSSARVGPDDALSPIPLRHSTVVASSTAQNDAGVFELNFRDERYMPFEGAGAVSRWRLSLPKVHRAFDYGTISDAILTVSYEASESDDLRARVESTQTDEQRAVTALLTSPGLPRAYSLRHEFGAAWQRFRSEVSSSGTRTLAVTLTDIDLPYLLDPDQIAVKECSVLARVASSYAGSHNATTLRATLTVGDQTRANLTCTAEKGLLVAKAALTSAQRTSGVPFTARTLAAQVSLVRSTTGAGGTQVEPVDPEALVDVWLVLQLVRR